MSNCEKCGHARVCGLKDKYEQYTKEFNELNKKWDLFESNPNCPEYMDKNVLVTNKDNYFNTKPLENNSPKITYDKNTVNSSKSNEANYIFKPMIISLDKDENITIQDIISELKKFKYNMGGCC